MATQQEIRQLTVAEIASQKATLTARRDELTSALAQHFKDHGFGDASADVNERPALIRERARLLLNGSGTAILGNRPKGKSAEDLRLERDAVDYVLKILDRKDVEVRAVEAQEWARDHDTEIRAVYKELFLAICKLRALRATADVMEQKAAGAKIAGAAFFQDWNRWGNVEGTLLLLNDGQFATCIKEAVVTGLATENEIRKALKP